MKQIEVNGKEIMQTTLPNGIKARWMKNTERPVGFAGAKSFVLHRAEVLTVLWDESGSPGSTDFEKLRQHNTAWAKPVGFNFSLKYQGEKKPITLDSNNNPEPEHSFKVSTTGAVTDSFSVFHSSGDPDRMLETHLSTWFPSALDRFFTRKARFPEDLEELLNFFHLEPNREHPVWDTMEYSHTNRSAEVTFKVPGLERKRTFLNYAADGDIEFNSEYSHDNHSAEITYEIEGLGKQRAFLNYAADGDTEFNRVRHTDLPNF